MYDWRKMTAAERLEILKNRKQRSYPWHSPPHLSSPGLCSYILSAACYEHEPLIAYNAERLDDFAFQLLKCCEMHAEKIYAWCILPNHYHAVVQTTNLRQLLDSIGKLHGRTSYAWNLEEKTIGRKVWFGCADRAMRSHGHLMASINYVHHNPVRHGYVERWQDWLWSSAARFLEEMGHDRAEQIWREYPIKNYGTGWDD